MEAERLSPNRDLTADSWATWLLRERYGASDEIKRSVSGALHLWRDRVLRNARIKPGDTVLDVGTGDGLVGLGALELVGPAGCVVFSDVSERLLRACRRSVATSRLPGSARFVVAAAEDLRPVSSASVDVATTRSVIMHVDDRPAAFREFYRVLRPGGRLSCFESLASRLPTEAGDRYRGYDVTGIRPIIDRIRDHGQRPSPLATETMMDFDDVDLVRWAREAGFAHVHLTLETDVASPSPMRNWEFFFHTRTHPLIPSLAEEASAALSPREQETLQSHLRPLVEAGVGERRQAVAYLFASR